MLENSLNLTGTGLALLLTACRIPSSGVKVLL